MSMPFLPDTPQCCYDCKWQGTAADLVSVTNPNPPPKHLLWLWESDGTKIPGCPKCNSSHVYNNFDWNGKWIKLPDENATLEYYKRMWKIADEPVIISDVKK